MPIHWVRIVESGHQSTTRLFELGLSFQQCASKAMWPSLDTMNAFLKNGEDDGKLGTDIEWESCSLTKVEYREAIETIMDGNPYQIDEDSGDWNSWFDGVKGNSNAQL